MAHVLLRMFSVFNYVIGRHQYDKSQPTDNRFGGFHLTGRVPRRSEAVRDRRVCPDIGLNFSECYRNLDVPELQSTHSVVV